VREDALAVLALLACVALFITQQIPSAALTAGATEVATPALAEGP
jgi:hypothetical protein